VINGGGSDGTGAADNAGVGDGLGVGSYVDVIGSPHGIKPVVGTGSNVGPLLLDPRAFVAPRGLSFGDSGRNYLRNPDRTNFNMSLLKHFKPLNEKLDIEFRAEAFNVFNHTQFSGPGSVDGDIGSSTFGSAISAASPRILQGALKFNF
jgi:hypothetical protein